jgi:hypothetical protein
MNRTIQRIDAITQRIVTEARTIKESPKMNSFGEFETLFLLFQVRNSTRAFSSKMSPR